MKRLVARFALLAAIAVLVAASSSTNAAPPQPSPTIAQLKAKNRTLRLANADLQDQVDAQNLVISDLQDQNARLRSRLANWPDPLDVITSRGPDGLWAAVQAIWQAFPRLPPSDLCGYDKSSTSGPGVGLSLTTLTFSSWTGC